MVWMDEYLILYDYLDPGLLLKKCRNNRFKSGAALHGCVFFVFRLKPELLESEFAFALVWVNPKNGPYVASAQTFPSFFEPFFILCGTFGIHSYTSDASVALL